MQLALRHGSVGARTAWEQHRASQGCSYLQVYRKCSLQRLGGRTPALSAFCLRRAAYDTCHAPRGGEWCMASDRAIWIACFSWRQNELSLRSLLRLAEPVPRSAINGRPLESIMQAPQKHKKSRGTLGMDVWWWWWCVCGEGGEGRREGGGGREGEGRKGGGWVCVCARVCVREEGEGGGVGVVVGGLWGRGRRDGGCVCVWWGEGRGGRGEGGGGGGGADLSVHGRSLSINHNEACT